MRRLLLSGAACFLFAQGAWGAAIPEGLSVPLNITTSYITVNSTYHSLFVGTITIPALTGSGAGIGCGKGQNNLLIGEDAGASLTTGCDNIAIGNNALSSTSNGGLDTAIGYNTLAKYNPATGEGENTGVGYAVMPNLTGPNARYNTALGTVCMQWFVQATFNVCIGSHAMIAVGASGTANSNVAIGYDALAGNQAPDSNVAIGAVAALSLNGSNDTTLIGAFAGRDATGAGHDGVTAVGFSTLYQNVNPAEATAMGYGTGLGIAGYSNTGMTIFGYNVGRAVNTGSDYLTAFGDNAARANSTGSNNDCFGAFSCYQNTTGTDNLMAGHGSGQGTAPYAVSNNVILGSNAGKDIATGGDANVLAGYGAGLAITTGCQNVIIGPANLTAASYNQVTTGCQNISIGNNTAIPTATANGQLDIGNYIYGTGLTATGATIATGKIGIGIKAPATNLDVAGTFNVSGASTLATLDLSTAAPTVAAAHIGYGSTTAAAANCNVAVPTPTGCIVVNVAGTTRYIPYY